MMATDIVPDLLDEINAEFKQLYDKSKKVQTALASVEKGKTTYLTAYNYAVEVGNIRAKVYKKCISSSRLPDGKMYYNIAERIFNDTFKHDFDLVSDVATSAQKTVNATAKIGLQAKSAKLNQDRIDGFINRVSSEDNFDDVAWILDEPVKTFTQSIVDDTIKTNAEFQSSAGIRATVVRNSDGGCCAWCSELAGEYTYPGVPGEVFARHDNCRCTVEYNAQKLSAYTSKAGWTNTFR